MRYNSESGKRVLRGSLGMKVAPCERLRTADALGDTDTIVGSDAPKLIPNASNRPPNPFVPILDTGATKRTGVHHGIESVDAVSAFPV
jgi:hypothetical protein